jgi:hypothetical protein
LLRGGSAGLRRAIKSSSVPTSHLLYLPSLSPFQIVDTHANTYSYILPPRYPTHQAMASGNNRHRHLSLVHPVSHFHRQTLSNFSCGFSHGELLLARHDTSHCTAEYDTTAISQEAIFPSCPRLSVYLRMKLWRVAVATPYFDWEAVNKLVTEQTQVGKLASA